MTHEFRDIVYQAKKNQENGLKSVLATVVFLEGSSYRKPGVRMLISENLKMVGAVSGGCVEAEVKRRTASVFQENKPKIMTYDGRYRLGCEGVLYILLEPFFVSNEFLEIFKMVLQKRQEFKIKSYFKLEDETTGNYGSIIHFKNQFNFTFNTIDSTKIEGLKKFEDTLNPSLKLLIIGAEHDAVKLCQMASLLGWDVDIITSIKNPKQLSHFPGAKRVTALTPELMDLQLDAQTVVVLMTHSYATDLKYLIKLANYELKYLGILGSIKRRNQLENDLLNYKQDLAETFWSNIYSPAGLNIGAITPEEIALSIFSEILSVVRDKTPFSLRQIPDKIHS